MSEPIIEVRHLSKSFGTHVVLRDVDFTVKPGDVTCVIGASGSGKSTLLRCINLLETPTSGSILFHGQDIMAKKFNPSAYRARVGMVFQSFNLFNNMTVLENCTAGLRYVLHQDKDAARRTALENLEKVGMAPYINARPRQLSGGQKQRVAIARALSMQPEVLLFDEPTSALDPQMVGEVLAVMRKRRPDHDCGHPRDGLCPGCFQPCGLHGRRRHRRRWQSQRHLRASPQPQNRRVPLPLPGPLTYFSGRKVGKRLFTGYRVTLAALTLRLTGGFASCIFIYVWAVPEQPEKFCLTQLSKSPFLLNCTPFVRQYGILFRKWGVFI